jgi:hypothetical protein
VKAHSEGGVHIRARARDVSNSCPSRFENTRQDSRSVGDMCFSLTIERHRHTHVVNVLISSDGPIPTEDYR